MYWVQFGQNWFVSLRNDIKAQILIHSVNLWMPTMCKARLWALETEKWPVTIGCSCSNAQDRQSPKSIHNLRAAECWVRQKRGCLGGWSGKAPGRSWGVSLTQWGGQVMRKPGFFRVPRRPFNLSNWRMGLEEPQRYESWSVCKVSPQRSAGRKLSTQQNSGPSSMIP